MVCPRCQNENPEGSHFCNQCGARLAVSQPPPVSSEPEIPGAWAAWFGDPKVRLRHVMVLVAAAVLIGAGGWGAYSGIRSVGAEFAQVRQEMATSVRERIQLKVAEFKFAKTITDAGVPEETSITFRQPGPIYGCVSYTHAKSGDVLTPVLRDSAGSELTRLEGVTLDKSEGWAHFVIEQKVLANLQPGEYKVEVEFEGISVADAHFLLE